ncbi:MAG: 30S ribosomal protein S6 [Chloroflexota bacterium]
MRNYEFTFIVRPDLEEEDMTSAVEQVQSWITEADGVVEHVDVWGKRRLAYPIQKHESGHYVHLKIKFQSDAVRELERRMQISENILRYLTVAIEE